MMGGTPLSGNVIVTLSDARVPERRHSSRRPVVFRSVTSTFVWKLEKPASKGGSTCVVTSTISCAYAARSGMDIASTKHHFMIRCCFFMAFLFFQNCIDPQRTL